MTPIDPKRFLLKMEELPELLRDPGFMIDGKLLVEVVHACADRLANKLGVDRSGSRCDENARHGCGTGGDPRDLTARQPDCGCISGRDRPWLLIGVDLGRLVVYTSRPARAVD